jgi:hypothetical protein
MSTSAPAILNSFNRFPLSKTGMHFASASTLRVKTVLGLHNSSLFSGKLKTQFAALQPSPGSKFWKEKASPFLYNRVTTGIAGAMYGLGVSLMRDLITPLMVRSLPYKITGVGLAAVGLGTVFYLGYRGYKYPGYGYPGYKDVYETAKYAGRATGGIIGGVIGGRWGLPGSLAGGALGANLGEGLVALVFNYPPDPNNQMQLPK